MKTNEIGIELKDLGLEDQNVYRNLTVDELVDDIVANNEGIIGLRGAAMVDTGIYTGRSPKDKYIVDEPSSNSDIWWGPINKKISEETFNELYDQVTNFYNINSQSKTYVFEKSTLKTLTSTQTYRPHNLNVYIKLDVGSDFLVEHTYLLNHQTGFQEKRPL